MAYVSSVSRFLDDTLRFSIYHIPAEAAGMDHSEQPLILKLFKGFGDDDCGQVREHPGKILVGHPTPITAVMKLTLPPPLFTVEVVERNVHGCRGKSQSIDQFRHGRKILQNQASSMNELKRLRL